MRKLIVVCVLAISPASAQSSVFGYNLIVNGGAESGQGGDGLTRISVVPGWQASGGCDVYAYATAYENVNGVGPYDIVPRGAGNNYFAGGAQTAGCTFSQNPSIDLTSGASTIDAGNATFAVSGYFGGYGEDNDNATLTLAFLNAAGATLKSVTIGPVGPGDRAYADNGLYLRKQIGQVPVGTRKAAVTLNMNWVDGEFNEAAADNLALILNSPASAQTLLNVNLLVNPGADASPGLDDNSTTDASTDLPGWVRSAFLTADSYQDSYGDLYQVPGGPADAASSYFYGGVDVSDDSNPIATAYQDIDISSAASLIDPGNLSYGLSGWLGGYADQDDNCVLTVQFQRWDGTVLSTATLGPVLAADRNDNSMLLFRSTSGVVPSGTRVMHVLMTMTREEGTNNDGIADSLSLVLGASATPGPEISQTIIGAGAFGAFDTVSPGGWIEVYGENLARDSRQWAGTDFNGVNAPVSLDGTSMTVGGQPAVIYFISSGQVNALVPGGVLPGMQPVILSTASGTGAPFMLSVSPSQPGLLAPASFIVDGSQYVAALFSDGSFVLPPGTIPGVASRQAKPGDTILLYGVGFGATTPAVPNGQITEVFNSLSAPFQILFGSTPGVLSYFGLAPNFVGLYQFNVIVPNVPANDFTPFSFTLNGVPGVQELYTAIQ